MDINFIINYMTHVLVLFTFLSILFVFYISKISKDAYSNELSHLITTAFNSLPKNNLNLNLDPLINIYSKPDPTSYLYNNLLFKSLFIINILLWIPFIIIIMILKSYNSDLDINEIIIENIVIFSLVGIVEYLFFTKIALNFVPVKPSFMKTQMIEMLTKKN